jgi:hypothetical protein
MGTAAAAERRAWDHLDIELMMVSVEGMLHGLVVVRWCHGKHYVGPM